MNLRTNLVTAALSAAGCSGFAAPSPAPTPPTVVAPVMDVPPGPMPTPGPTATPLQVRITSAPSLMVGVPATFVARSTFGTGAVSYRWTFGAGGGTEADPSSASTHTFGRPGMATVTVTASDERGEISDSLESMVMAQPTPTTPTPTGPTTPTTPTLVVTLTCTANPPLTASACNVAAAWGGVPVSSQSTGFVRWDWGDGKEDNVTLSPIKQHIYSQAGTFRVVAKVGINIEQVGAKDGEAAVTLAIGGTAATN